MIPLVGLQTGCTTPSQPGDTKWTMIAEIASRRGTYEVLKANPEYAVYFDTTVTALDQLLLKETVSYDDLDAALKKLPVKELQGAEGSLIIRDAVDIYDALLRETLRLKDGTRLRAFAEAIRDGILAGISLAQPTTSATGNDGP